MVSIKKAFDTSMRAQQQQRRCGWLWLLIPTSFIFIAFPYWPSPSRQQTVVRHVRPLTLLGVQGHVGLSSADSSVVVRESQSHARARATSEPEPSRIPAVKTPSETPAHERVTGAESKTRRTSSSAVDGTRSGPEGARGIELQLGAADRPMGRIRVHLRPEWSVTSFDFARAVGAAGPDAQASSSNVYRLEPGFLIQGRIGARGVKPNQKITRAPKVMERGEIGWAGGSAGPDFFIYLGNGPASWLGNPHEGTIWAEVADEESLAVADNISLLDLGQKTAPGQMHLMKRPLPFVTSAWNADEHGDAALPFPNILKVKGASLDSQAAACPEACNAFARTELHGGVVKWGAHHKVDSPSACCAACQADAKCNVWVHCGSKERCGAKHGECWLKQKKDLWSDLTLLVGTNPDGWVAGAKEAPPNDHASGARFDSAHAPSASR